MSRTEGIVLNEMKFQETSKILNIYTKEYGKINVMAKGAYKAKSRLTAYTQVFSQCEYELHKGRSWYYINEGSVVNSFYSIREDIERVIYGFYILELMNKATPDEEKNETLFLLLEKALTVLSNLEDNYLRFIVAYELKFISFVGYRPCINECVLCEKTKFKNLKFSIPYGGLVCEDCMNIDFKALYMDEKMLRAMNELLYSPLESLDGINVDEDVLVRIQSLLEQYILYSLDRKEFNSLAMLKTMIG